LINIHEIISVYFFCGGEFFARNIHIADLELDNISNIKMQSDNKLKPFRKNKNFPKNGFARIYMLFIYQGWSVPDIFEDRLNDVNRLRLVSLISYTWLCFHFLRMAILRTTHINRKTSELNLPPAF